MKRTAAYALAIVVGLLVPLSGSAQGLAEAASKEQQRRKALAEAGSKPVRVVTDADLPSHDDAAVPPSEEAPTAPVPGRGLSLGTATARSEPRTRPPTCCSEPRNTRGESYWRGRAESARAAVRNAEQRVERLEREASTLVYAPAASGGCGPRRGGNPNLYYEWQARRQKVFGELEQAKAGVAKARRALDDLDDEARRASAMPGWLRER